MIVAFLFPLTLGLFFFFLVNAILTYAPREGFLFTGAFGILAVIFGWFFLQALRRGRRAVPPVPHRGRRRVFAVLMLLAVGLVGFESVVLSDEELRYSSEKHLGQAREDVVRYTLQRTAAEKEVQERQGVDRPGELRARARVGDAEKSLAVAERKLAIVESAPMRVALAAPLGAFFVVAGVAMAILVLRKAPTLADEGSAQAV